MPTIIHFVGRDQVMVREDEGEVQAAFTENGGNPVALTHQRSGNPVFVNLGQVTYWQGRGTRDQTPLPWTGARPYSDPALSAGAEAAHSPANRQFGHR